MPKDKSKGGSKRKKDKEERKKEKEAKSKGEVTTTTHHHHKRRSIKLFHRDAVVGKDDPFILRIFNTLTYTQVKLTITKQYTVRDVVNAYVLAYAPFESHPEYYVWQDMYGKNLKMDKTVVENGLCDDDEVVEFDGIAKEPVILLIFKDGFENEHPLTLNPLKRSRLIEYGLCRNYGEEEGEQQVIKEPDDQTKYRKDSEEFPVC